MENNGCKSISCFLSWVAWLTRNCSLLLLLLSRFSHVWLCDPIDGSPTDSSVPGILQARVLEWVAISPMWKWKVKVKSLSRVRLFETPWTAAHQAPPSMGFFRQEYWSGVPLPAATAQQNEYPYCIWLAQDKIQIQNYSFFLMYITPSRSQIILSQGPSAVKGAATLWDLCGPSRGPSSPLNQRTEPNVKTCKQTKALLPYRDWTYPGMWSPKAGAQTHHFLHVLH